jgi:hypothetical protein
MSCYSASDVDFYTSTTIEANCAAACDNLWQFWPMALLTLLATQHVVIKSALKYLKLLWQTFDYFSHQFISNMIKAHMSWHSNYNTLLSFHAVVDLVLIMSVNPGFGGQSFIESQVKKIAELRRLCAEKVYPLVSFQVFSPTALNPLCSKHWSVNLFLSFFFCRAWIPGLRLMVVLVRQMPTRWHLTFSMVLVFNNPELIF